MTDNGDGTFTLLKTGSQGTLRAYWSIDTATHGTALEITGTVKEEGLISGRTVIVRDAATGTGSGDNLSSVISTGVDGSTAISLTDEAFTSNGVSTGYIQVIVTSCQVGQGVLVELSVGTQSNAGLIVSGGTGVGISNIAENGDVTVVATTPPFHAGSYTFAASDLTNGPKILNDPDSTGTTNTDDILTAVDAFAVGLASHGPIVFSTVWDGSGADGTGNTYTVLADDALTGVTITQTATNAGSTPATSATVSVIDPPAYSDTGQAFVATNSLTRNSNLGAGDPGVDHMVVFICFDADNSGKNIYVKFNAAENADLRRQSNGAVSIGATQSGGTSNSASASGKITIGERHSILAYIGAGGVKLRHQQGSGTPEDLIDVATDFSGMFLDYQTVILPEADPNTIYRVGIWTPSSAFDPLDASNFRAFVKADGTTVGVTA